MKRTVLFSVVVFICCGFTSSEEIRLKWNFSSFKKLTFRYEQTMVNKFDLTGDGSTDATEILGSGLLIVEVKDLLAEIKITDLNVKMSSIDSLGNRTQIMSNTMPDLTIDGLQENGEIRGQLNQQTEILAKTLFPVLENSIQRGETRDLPLTMTFNRLGTPLIIKGNNKINFVSKTDGVSKIETIIDISENADPGQAKNYVCYLKGSSSFDFNSDKGYFLKGDIRITMNMGTATTSDMNSESHINLNIISVE